MRPCQYFEIIFLKDDMMIDAIHLGHNYSDIVTLGWRPLSWYSGECSSSTGVSSGYSEVCSIRLLIILFLFTESCCSK